MDAGGGGVIFFSSRSTVKMPMFIPLMLMHAVGTKLSGSQQNKASRQMTYKYKGDFLGRSCSMRSVRETREGNAGT